MKLKTNHHQAIELLAANVFLERTEASIAREVGCNPKSLSRWKADPDFAQALEEARSAWFDAWRRETRHLKFTHRRARLEELHRIYGKIPDTYLSSETRSGKQIHRLNADFQVKILELIAVEASEDAGDKLIELEEERTAVIESLKKRGTVLELPNATCKAS